MLSMEEKITRPTDYFGVNLAVLLAEKINPVAKEFNSRGFIESVKRDIADKSLTQRVDYIADQLKNYLPSNYKNAVSTLIKIMGEENANETGMFKEYYACGQVH